MKFVSCKKFYLMRYRFKWLISFNFNLKQKFLKLTDEECLKFLDSTDWDIHKAIKCIVSKS